MQETVSWKKIRAKSGGHLYHHIHELDCIQFLMGPATEVTMVGSNVAHKGVNYGDEGAIRLDMKDAGVTLRTPEGDEHFLIHRTKEEDNNRTLTYNTSMEMEYLNGSLRDCQAARIYFAVRL
ncbi:MAG: hypothetical protein IJC59_02200 [Lachnospiraceae bacterium]|nr:hypothetical protein [Lachnospiraceae bacterium]